MLTGDLSGASLISVSGISYFKKWFLPERKQENGSNVEAYQLVNGQLVVCPCNKELFGDEKSGLVKYAAVGRS